MVAGGDATSILDRPARAGAQLSRPGDGLGAVGHLELAEQVAHVALDGVRRDHAEGSAHRHAQVTTEPVLVGNNVDPVQFPPALAGQVKAAGGLSSKAAVRRLGTVTLAGLRPPD